MRFALPPQPGCSFRRISSVEILIEHPCFCCGAALGRAYLLSRQLEWLHAHTGVCLGKGEEKKPSWLHSSIIHPPFLSCTCQRGRQATDPDRRLQWSALVSVSWRLRWLRMAANTNRREHFRERKRGHCWDFLCGGFKSVEWLLEPCSRNAFRHHSEMEMVPWEKNLSQYLIAIIKGVS